MPRNETGQKVNQNHSQQLHSLSREFGAFHNQSNKGHHVEIIQSYNGIGELPIKPKPEETRIGLFAEDINSCKDVETLKQYRLLVKGKPELQEAYDNKLKELQ